MEAATASSVMSLMRPPSSTVIAVSSRRPPSSITTRWRETGPIPAEWNSSVSPSACTIVMKFSVTSRCRSRAAAPMAGRSRVALSISAERDSADEIHASMAWRTWTRHGELGSTAAEICCTWPA